MEHQCLYTHLPAYHALGTNHTPCRLSRTHASMLYLPLCLPTHISSIFLGSSMKSFTLTKNVTASRPSNNR